MKKIYTLSLTFILSLFIIENSIAQSVESLERFGDNGYDAGLEMTIDEVGNSVRAGIFSGKIYYANDSIVAGNNGAGFIAKYNANDLAQWAINIEDVSTVDVKLDAFANVYFAARKTGTIATPLNLGPNCMVAAYNGFYIAKLNSSGNCQWAFGPDFGNAEVHAITLDTAGNVYATGEIYNGTTVGGTTITTNGGTDLFVMKINANGSFAYINTFGGTGDDVGRDIWADKNGKIFVTGDIRNCLDFGGITTTFNGINDFVIAGFNASTGSANWVYNNGSADYSYGYSLEGDHLGNLFVTGSYTFAPMFGNSTFTENNRFFLAKFTDLGSLTWSKVVDANSSWTQPHNQGATTQWMGNKMLLNASENELYLTVHSSGEANFGSTTLNNGSKGIYITKYDLNGDVIWAQLSEGGDNKCNGLGKTTSGNIRLFGTFENGMTMGDFTINTLNSNDDYFMAELSDTPEVDPSSINILNKNLSIHLFPNPTSNLFTVSLDQSNLNFKLEVISVLGKKITSQNFINSKVIINTENWGKGIYFVKILSHNGKLLNTQKVLVK